MSIGVLFNLFMKIFLLLDNLSTNDIFWMKFKTEINC